MACSSAPQVVNLDVVIGHETDAMSQAPDIVKVSIKGTSTPSGSDVSAEAAPGGTLDFGEVNTDAAFQFDATGYDGQGNAVMRGRSIGGIVLGGRAGTSLTMFVERLGGWSRPPGTLAHTHMNAPAVSVGERYLFTTGGDDGAYATGSEEYDLYPWAGATGSTFPFVAKTLASSVTAVLAIGSGASDATWLKDSGFAEPSPISGFSFDEISGGKVVTSDDGRAFLVGATRPGKASDAVIEVASDQTVIVHRLVFPRQGAAAAWLVDVGLVIYGGDDKASAVEVLPSKGSEFAVRDFPPDATTGADMAATTLQTMVITGGVNAGKGAKTRLFDPRCTSACTLKELHLATPDTALSRTATFALAKGRAVIVGDEADPKGQTRTFVIDYLNPSITEMPLREPRRGATAVPAPNGTLALMGGVHLDGTDALTVEMYFPE